MPSNDVTSVCPLPTVIFGRPTAASIPSWERPQFFLTAMHSAAELSYRNIPIVNVKYCDHQIHVRFQLYIIFGGMGSLSLSCGDYPRI